MKKAWWTLLLCIYQIFENSDMFAKDFIQHRYYRSMFTPLFLWLKTPTKETMPKLDLENVKIPEPIDE